MAGYCGDGTTFQTLDDKLDIFIGAWSGGGEQ